jgi:uncharacterized protein YndB with AHSA1/START domain
VTPQVLVSVRLKASPARAFEIFTRDIALWWTPNALFRFTPRSPGVLAFEPHEGGRFTETLANGTVFEIGRIRVWEPGERLVFGWRQASFRSGQQTKVEVTFETVGAETRVTVVHRGWDSVPDEHVARHGFPDAIFLRWHGEWWQVLLARLREHGPQFTSRRS